MKIIVDGLGKKLEELNVSIKDEKRIKEELQKRGVPASEVDFFLNAYIALLEADASVMQVLILQQFYEAVEFLKSITVVTKDQQEIPLRDIVD